MSRPDGRATKVNVTLVDWPSWSALAPKRARISCTPDTFRKLTDWGASSHTTFLPSVSLPNAFRSAPAPKTSPVALSLM